MSKNKCETAATSLDTQNRDERVRELTRFVSYCSWQPVLQSHCDASHFYVLLSQWARCAPITCDSCIRKCQMLKVAAQIASWTTNNNIVKSYISGKFTQWMEIDVHGNCAHMNVEIRIRLRCTWRMASAIRTQFWKLNYKCAKSMFATHRCTIRRICTQHIFESTAKTS